MVRRLLYIGAAILLIIAGRIFAINYNPVRIIASPDVVSIALLAPPGTIYDWMGGMPTKTDNINYEWAGGVIFVRLEIIGGGGPEITNTQSTWPVGIIDANTTSSTAINWSTIENTGSGAVDVTIQGTDLTGGGDTWDLDDSGSPGENIYALYAGLDDDDDNFDIIVKESTTNILIEDLPEDATQDWGLKIYMPTSVTDYEGQDMTSTVTLVASAAS